MTVRNGREFLSIPGPTTVPDEVLSAMHHPAMDIYAGPLVDMTMSSLDDLRRVFRTQGRAYIYIANGHGAWEGALSNVLSRGDKVLIVESGTFAILWGAMAEALGVEVETVPGDGRRAADLGALEARLRADKSGEIKAVLIVQVDTGSGVVNHIPDVRRAMDGAGHGALLMVDVIASLATMPFEMDEWGVDVAVAGAQKGLMMPPGLSFVAASGGKTKAAHEKADLRSQYWDWTLREGELHYQKYCGTPPVNMVLGLRKSLDMIFEEGFENVFRRHALLAEAVRRAVTVWSEGGVVEFNIIEPAERSNAVTTLVMADGRNPAPLLDYCHEKCGVILGIGIRELDGKGIRIAHMGHVNAPMILGTLGVVEVGLTALGIPHGKGGVGAAIEWLGQSVPA